MKTLKLFLVTADDWEGLYVNEVLYAQGHHVTKEELINAINDNIPFDEIIYDREECNYEWVEYHGDLPSNLDDVVRVDEEWNEPA